MVGSLQLLVNCISLSLEDFLRNFSPTRIDFIKLGESITLKLSIHLFTKFDQVNPCRIKVIKKVFKGKTDAVDEQLEAANH